MPLGQPGAGNLASVTDSASGSTTSYAYTSSGYFSQLSRSLSAGGTTPVYSVASADASLRPLETSYGSASFSNQLQLNVVNTLTDTYAYDRLSQLREADYASNSSNGTTSGTKTYGYDTQTGNLATKSDAGPSSGTYAYAGGPHQLSAITGTGTGATAYSYSYGYDARGNVLNGEDGGLYGWSSFDRVLTVSKDGTGLQYYYDTDHNRVAVTATTANGSATKLYLRGSGGYAEVMLDANGNKAGVLDYFSASGHLVGVQATSVSGGTSQQFMSYLHTDMRGSVIAISDDSGMTNEIDSYDPWGSRRNATGGGGTGQIASASSYGYIGEEQIAGVTNLLNLNARLYDPLIGRFLSADPIGLKGGRNVYGYSGNNPTTASDPSGLDSTITPACDAGVECLQATGQRPKEFTWNIPFNGGGFAVTFRADWKADRPIGRRPTAVMNWTGHGTPVGISYVPPGTSPPAGAITAAGLGNVSAASMLDAILQALFPNGVPNAVSGLGGDSNGGLGGYSANNGQGGNGGGGIQPAVYLPGGRTQVSGGCQIGQECSTFRTPEVITVSSTGVPYNPATNRYDAQLQQLAQAAQAAARTVPKVWYGPLRGTLIHRNFAYRVLLMSFSDGGYVPEQGYLNRLPVSGWPFQNPPGTSYADAIYGPILTPYFAVDLKTGGAFMSDAQRDAYFANLPLGIKLYTIYVE